MIEKVFQNYFVDRSSYTLEIFLSVPLNTWSFSLEVESRVRYGAGNALATVKEGSRVDNRMIDRFN